jgi:hypothetical protein
VLLLRKSGSLSPAAQALVNLIVVDSARKVGTAPAKRAAAKPPRR